MGVSFGNDCECCMLKAKDLGYCIEDKIIFENLNFEISWGERVLLKGKNGSGKSSLLGILQGFLKPSFGVVERERELRVGYLFQESEDQFIAPSVLEDVAFSLLAKGEERAEMRAREMLERLEISHLSEKSLYHLSGGEQRLVALAGVLVLECDLYLLDEPFNEIDSLRQEIIKSIIQEKNGAFLIATHGGLEWEREIILHSHTQLHSDSL
ncbi:energy-coupling factor ABC transporter ATP-binding protein [Helicobacter brantae]|uniref:ABC transporter ATP-binding protein n=1 Tax=Helicobacter brantae TaxID=375927 RepID=A0A3D8J2U9_9HELI|nr:ABC transporter ATP-binding protein [Helicobacter brantae]RDU71799.1 ABC transporter ATP-binding protein [Helicobacter brantae]